MSIAQSCGDMEETKRFQELQDLVAASKKEEQDVVTFLEKLWDLEAASKKEEQDVVTFLETNWQFSSGFRRLADKSFEERTAAKLKAVDEKSRIMLAAKLKAVDGKSRIMLGNMPFTELFDIPERRPPATIITVLSHQAVERSLLFLALPKAELLSDWRLAEADMELHNRFKLISGVYRIQERGRVTWKMEHCAFNGQGNRWTETVKCRIQNSLSGERRDNFWFDIHKFYPDAEVEIKKNSVKVIADSLKENHEFAVFGVPDVNGRKRMQVGLFGEKPLLGEDWKIWVILFDDTMMAFQHVCDMEEGKGRQLVTTLAGLFVFNSSEDIQINVGDVKLGWKLKDSNVKIIKSKDAWNSPENSTDFPRCYFEFSHVDETKQMFTFRVTVRHQQDSTETEVVAVYEKPGKDRDEFNLYKPVCGSSIGETDVLVFCQMFVLLLCFIMSAFQPAGAARDHN